MKQYVLILPAVLLCLAGCTSDSGDARWPAVTRASRPWTRWWWMGSAVDSANLAHSLETLSRAGIGGVEITPIYGVKGREAQYIDYLSPRWMAMLAFTESEAERLDMGVDMNNGTGWPFGGPDVSEDDAASKAVFKEYRVRGGQRPDEAFTLSGQLPDRLMACSASGERLDLTGRLDSDGILDWTAPPGGDSRLTALFVVKTRQQVKRAAPGGQGYVLDHFNRDAVERYFAKFDRAFAENRTPFPHGFFNDSYEVYGADWTPALPDEFERRRGYRLQDYFPELLADGATDSSARVVADYRETVADILHDNFTQVWTDWAHSHGVSIRNQAHGSPANLLDLYALVDIPECESFGITDFDIPGLRRDSIRRTNDSDPGVLKYASSAAHVAGKKYTSAETFTWLTEHFRTSLSQCKPELDLMFASGVNRVFFHGTAYSPADAPWPGWKFYASTDMSPTNTIWRDAPAFFDYIARTQAFLQSGAPDSDFLLYLPVYDFWHEQRGNYYLPFAIHNMRAMLPEFCDAVDSIMAAGHDVDYISDRFLQTCTVENGLLKTAAGTLYRALILPRVRRIPVETLAHIHDLARQGAAVVFAGQYPEDVPGLSRLEERRQAFGRIMENLRAEKTVTVGSFDASLTAAFETCREAFVADFGGKMIRRRHDGGHIYFFAMLQNRPVDGWVTLGTEAESAVLYDAVTGRTGKARLRSRNGRTEVYMQLRPGESLIMKTFARRNIRTENWAYYRPTGREIVPETEWKMHFVESEPAVNDTFRLPAPVSWTELDSDVLKRNMGTARYEIKFDLAKKPGMEYILCMGDVRESAAVSVNGTKAGVRYAVPFEMPVGRWLRDGENVIAIDVTGLPANRIADYDRRGVEWRIFHEINFVDITYRNTRFDTWQPLPSGLPGPVVIREMEMME
ncbi:MAG: glycosyl hydrolase family 2 [Tannerella sp.]|nr:glycosyl hydrolase family 2 [Tannerella sp.]